jgi:aspartate/methionine/tyrosine aminotransferase
MELKPFRLERYFAQYEFTAPYLLCCSDCESLSLQELLDMADEECLQIWNNLRLGYTESQGHPLLRKEIASLYSTINEEQVLVLTPEEGIYIAMQSLLKAGDHVVCTFPGYQSLYEIARSLRCEVECWLPRQDKGWVFHISDLKKLIRKNTRLLVINFPHNPTGALITRKELEEIIELARAHNILVFSDEMYRFLEQDEWDRLPATCDIYEHAVSLCGMSKSMALPGLRTGWLVTRNPVMMQQFATFKDYTTICNASTGEILALVGLRAKKSLIERNINIIRTNLKLLDEFFSRHQKLFGWQAPDAGPIAFIEFKGSVSVDSFCQDLVEKKGVLLLPGSVYEYPGNYFRIGFGRKNMKEALGKLDEYLNTIGHINTIGHGLNGL